MGSGAGVQEPKSVVLKTLITVSLPNHGPDAQGHPGALSDVRSNPTPSAAEPADAGRDEAFVGAEFRNAGTEQVGDAEEYLAQLLTRRANV